MKRCPYCGASLPGSAVSFWPELREAAAEKEEATTVAAKEKAGKAPANEEAARTQAGPNHAAVSTSEQGAGRWLRWVL